MLDSKASLTKMGKIPKDQKRFAWGLQNGCSEKIENVRGKCRNPATLT